MSEAGRAGGYYKIHERGPGFYRIGSPEGVHSELLVGAEKALLLDTGFGIGNLPAAVAEVTDKPVTVINTHGHPDHACGNFRFAGPIYINEADAELCRARTTREARTGALARIKAGGELPEDFDEEYYLSGGSGELAPLNEGDIFDLGGLTLEAVGLPGHTPGSIGMLWKEEKILFTGDAVNSCLWLWQEESLSMSKYIETLRKAESLDFERMVQSHYNRIEDKSILSLYMRAAVELDFDKGFPFRRGNMAAGRDVRMCPVDGLTPEDVSRPDFAAIVISPEHFG